jgi:hypothetical protein
MTTKWMLPCAAALLLGACGGGEKAASESGGTNAQTAEAEPAAEQTAARVSACDIVTEADAERALGMKVKREGDPGAGSMVQTCSYAADTQELTKLQNAVSVSLTPYPVSSLMPAEERQRLGSVPIEGLGDEALFTESAGLMVTKGQTTATYLMMGNGYDRRAVLTELARATVDRF